MSGAPGLDVVRPPRFTSGDMQRPSDQEARPMASRTFTARGHKVRTQSHFRYQIVRVTEAKATPVGRSDNRQSAVDRARGLGVRKPVGGPVEPIVVIDATTGEEIYGNPAPEAAPAEDVDEAQRDAERYGPAVRPMETNGAGAALELDPKVAAARDLIAEREAAVAPAMERLNEALDAAHEIGMQILRLDDAGKDIPAELKEADEKATNEVDRKRRVYNNAEAGLVAARRELDRLTDPREVEKRTEQRLRLNNLKERTEMAKKDNKSTALDQGFPSVYLANDGKGPNFFPGGDAAAKGDMFNAILHVDLGIPVKKDARYDFTTEEGLALAKKLIGLRGWNALLEKSRQAALGRIAAAERAAEKKATAKATKKAPAKKAPAKKATGGDGGDEVTPDPKPTPKPRTGRKVGR